MYPLLKDHKEVKDGIHRTRPVVSGGQSMGVHLNNIISMVLDPIAREADDSEEVISPEEALARIAKANKKIIEEAQGASNNTTQGGGEPNPRVRGVQGGEPNPLQSLQLQGGQRGV